MEKHPCFECYQQAFEHAIICPVLGVIASGRCKRYRHLSADRAWERLHGIERMSINTRTAIKLRGHYYDYLELHGRYVKAGGEIRLSRGKGVANHHRANSNGDSVAVATSNRGMLEVAIVL